MGGVSQAIPTSFPNHYQEDISNLAAGVATGGAYFQGQPSYNVQPLNYHFYAPIGPHTDNLTPYQKSIHDLFLSDRLREELQRKSEASHQVMLSKYRRQDDDSSTNPIRYPSKYWYTTKLIPFLGRFGYSSKQG